MMNLKSTLFAVGFGAVTAASAYAQGTAFTYQGRLNNGTNVATGTYNLAFTLFDASTNGNVIGHPSTNFAVTVNGGLFTVPVDFGANALTGATNWIQIAVGTNLTGLYTNLTPRQQLTPVPYAVYAEGANASGLVGTLSGNGSGLTNLTATQLTSGTVPDARLSTNVALLNASQTFTGGNTFNGSVGIGTPPVGTVPLSVQGNSSVGDGVIEAYQNGGATTGYGVAGYSLLPGGHGVVGEADTELPNVTGPGASDIGVTGTSFGTNGTGVFGLAGASTGVNYGIVGQTFSPQGYAGYFLGQSYFGGSVGIGTTSPAKQLDLTGTAAGVAAGSSIDPSIFMRVNNTSSDGNTSIPDFAGIGFGHNSTRQAIVGGTFGNDFLDFYTGGSLTTPKMRIDINGTVGIMTNNVLELGYGVAGKESNAGKIGYEKFTADSLDIVGAGTNSSSRKIKFWAEGGANFNGNVGIGTPTPNSTLAVVGNIYMGTQRPNTTFNQVGDTIYLGAEQKYLGNALGTPVNGSTDWVNLMANGLSSGIIFGLSTSLTSPHSNNIPLMVIKSNGNVGIGGGAATNPATALQVNGTVTATSFAGSFAGSGSGLTNVAHLNGGNIFTGQQTLTNAFFGYVHSDGIREVGTYVDSNGGWFGTISDHPLLFYVNNGFASMAIATNGNAGIGTVTPANKLDVQGSGDFTGNLGIGTTTPAGHLSVATAQGTVNIMDGQFTPELVMTGGGAPGDLRLRNILEVWPNTNATVAGKVDVRGTNGSAVITLDGSNGNVTCVAVNITSDRNAKENFSPVNARAVLDKVARLPITEWQYKQQADTRHIGPMAQDFSNAFALGTDDKHISVVDEGGVALAAIQGLNEKLDEKDARIRELEKSVTDLKLLVGKLAGVQIGGAK